MAERKFEKTQDKKFLLNFWSYIKLVLFTVFHPRQFVRQTPQFLKYKNYKASLLYLFINTQLGLIFFGILKIFNSHNSNIFSPRVVLFPTFSEIFLLTPLVVLGFLAFVVFLHLIAKFMGGSGKIQKSLGFCGWLSAPLIFVWLPYIQILAMIFQIYLLVEGFRKVHLYPKRIAIATVFMPIIWLYLFLNMMNYINLP